MSDILLYESGIGGELNIKAGDIELTDSIFNQIYLAFFGGSKNGDQWWANSFMKSDDSGQMISELETALNNNPLTGYGALKIKQAAENDLEFLKDTSEITITVNILSVDKVQILVKIDFKTISFVVDAMKNELIEIKII